MKSVLKALSKIMMIIALVVIAVIAVGLLTGGLTMSTTLFTVAGIKFSVGMILALAGGLALIAGVISPKGASAGIARVSGAAALVGAGIGSMIGGFAGGLGDGFGDAFANSGFFKWIIGAAILVGGVWIYRTFFKDDNYVASGEPSVSTKHVADGAQSGASINNLESKSDSTKAAPILEAKPA